MRLRRSKQEQGKQPLGPKSEKTVGERLGKAGRDAWVRISDPEHRLTANIEPGTDTSGVVSREDRDAIHRAGNMVFRGKGGVQSPAATGESPNGQTDGVWHRSNSRHDIHEPGDGPVITPKPRS